MNNTRKSLIEPRTLAFSHQHGYCYYCNQPMWNNSPHQFSTKYKITKAQTKHFQCTGEHLTPHHDGGSCKQYNIVAACRFCNLRRHRFKTVPIPEEYKKHVQQRVNQGRWHNIRLATLPKN